MTRSSYFSKATYQREMVEDGLYRHTQVGDIHKSYQITVGEAAKHAHPEWVGKWSITTIDIFDGTVITCIEQFIDNEGPGPWEGDDAPAIFDTESEAERHAWFWMAESLPEAELAACRV